MNMPIDNGITLIKTVDFVCGVSEFNAERTIDNTVNVTNTTPTVMIAMYKFF